ncbi:hypothetical protein M413DRAFT_25627 [Hebeloma cylindrosporum]|uniref:Uncharacterized protein n=1 Tax=Hebeloma cylindrosporum TaxID=76867 RepID=A0A0C3C5Q2_HEBCY|nr:hypothetical protein M413DRAFT_25627 [Hebeloma cylindrosporum h7]
MLCLRLTHSTGNRESTDSEAGRERASLSQGSSSADHGNGIPMPPRHPRAQGQGRGRTSTGASSSSAAAAMAALTSDHTASRTTSVPGPSAEHAPSVRDPSPPRHGVDIPWNQRGLLVPSARRSRWGPSQQPHDGATTSSDSPPDISTAAGSFVTAAATIEVTRPRRIAVASEPCHLVVGEPLALLDLRCGRAAWLNDLEKIWGLVVLGGLCDPRCFLVRPEPIGVGWRPSLNLSFLGNRSTGHHESDTPPKVLHTC